MCEYLIAACADGSRCSPKCGAGGPAEEGGRGNSAFLPPPTPPCCPPVAHTSLLGCLELEVLMRTCRCLAYWRLAAQASFQRNLWSVQTPFCSCQSGPHEFTDFWKQEECQLTLCLCLFSLQSVFPSHPPQPQESQELPAPLIVQMKKIESQRCKLFLCWLSILYWAVLTLLVTL